MQIGFVGLGRMGGPISGRLAAAGHAVRGYDTAGSAERVQAGVSAAGSLEAAAGAEVVFLSLPNGAICQEVCARAAAAPVHPHVVVDLSTIGVAAARGCAETLAAVGIAYVDAPISGGVAGARSGALAMMVGADATLYERVRPLLEIVARHCFRVGDRAGQGQAMKLLNNFVSATAMAATSEAVVFGTKLGLDPAQMVEILNVSSGRTTASSDKFPRAVLSRTYDFGFAGAHMAKDVRLYREVAEAADVPREVAEAVAALWTRFDAANPGADFTLIHRYLEAEAGLAEPRP